MSLKIGSNLHHGSLEIFSGRNQNVAGTRPKLEARCYQGFGDPGRVGGLSSKFSSAVLQMYRAD